MHLFSSSNSIRLPLAEIIGSIIAAGWWWGGGARRRRRRRRSVGQNNQMRNLYWGKIDGKILLQNVPCTINECRSSLSLV